MKHTIPNDDFFSMKELHLAIIIDFFFGSLRQKFYLTERHWTQNRLIESFQIDHPKLRIDLQVSFKPSVPPEKALADLQLQDLQYCDYLDFHANFFGRKCVYRSKTLGELNACTVSTLVLLDAETWESLKRNRISTSSLNLLLLPSP